MDSKMRADMERVLRAMDVIPPYDSHNVEHRHGVSDSHDVSSHRVAQPGRRTKGQRPPVRASDNVSIPTSGGHGVPMLDLGEKILAEQRRVTAKKRKAPGADQPEPNDVRNEPPSVAAASVAAASNDAAQLRQIVTDIVTRDIERLCNGLKHATGRPGGQL